MDVDADIVKDMDVDIDIYRVRNRSDVRTILAVLGSRLDNLLLGESDPGIDLEVTQNSLYRLSKGTFHLNWTLTGQSVEVVVVLGVRCMYVLVYL